MDAEVNRLNRGGETLPTARLAPDVAASMGLPPGATVADANAKIQADTEDASTVIAFAIALDNSDLVQEQIGSDSKVRGHHWDTQNNAIAQISQLKEDHPELAGAFQAIEDRAGTSGLPGPLRDGIAHLGRTGTFSEEALQELFAGYDAAQSDASAAMTQRGDDDSTIRFDGRTGQFTFTTNNDDDGGSGADVVVSTDSNGYTSVRTADGSSIYDSDGNLVSAIDSEGRATSTAGAAPTLAEEVSNRTAPTVDSQGRETLPTVETLGVIPPAALPTVAPEAPNAAAVAPPAIAVGDVVSADVAEWLNAPHLEGRVITDIEPNEQGGQNIYTRTADAPALSGLEADEVGDPAQAHRESTIVTQWQAAQLGNPELEGYVKQLTIDEDGNPQVILVPPPNRRTEDEQRLANARDIDPLGDDLAIDHNVVNAAALLNAADDYGIQYDPKRPDWDSIALQVQRHQETAAAVAYEDGVSPYYEGAKETGVQKRERLLAMGADITDPDDQGYIYEGPRMTGLQMERLLLQDGVGTGGVGDAAAQAQLHQQQQQSLAASIPDESAITRADELATQNLLDQGYETWGGAFVRYLDEDGNPVSSDDDAFYRIHAEQTFTGFDENGVSEYRTELQLQERNQGVTAWVEGAEEWTNTGMHPAELENPHGLPALGRSDQNIAAQAHYARLSGRWVDANGVLELPDQQRVFERPNTRHGMGTIHQVEMRGVPLDYVVGVNPDGTVNLRDGWEDAVVAMHPDRTRVAGLNPDGTLQTEGGTAWHVAKPWVSAVPGAGTLITAYDIQHPSSPDGEGITGEEWRQLGAAATIDSVYLLGWPYGTANVVRGVGTGVLKGSGKSVGHNLVRAPRTLFYDASLPVVGKEVGRQGLTIVRNPISSFRGSRRPIARGLRNEFGEEFLVEYPIETLAPHAWGVGEKPLITGGEDGILSYRPGSAWQPSERQLIMMTGFAGGFGVAEGAGRRRGGVSSTSAPHTINAPQVQTPTVQTNQPPPRFRHHSASEPTEGFNVGQPYDAWPADLVDMHFGHRSSSGLLTPQPTLPSGYTLGKSNIVVPGPAAPTVSLPTTGLITPTATSSQPTPASVRRVATPTSNLDPAPDSLRPAAASATQESGSDAPNRSDSRKTLKRPGAAQGSPTTRPNVPSPAPTSGNPAPDATPSPRSSSFTPGRPQPHTQTGTPTDPYTPNPQGEDPYTPDPTDPDAPTPDAGTPQPARPAIGTPAPGTPTQGTPLPTPGMPTPGTPSPGTPGPAAPSPDSPSPSAPTTGTPKPTPTTSDSTTPETGTPGEPTPTQRKPDPKRPSPDPTTSPTSTPSPDKKKDKNVRRRELANPAANDPNVHPREVQFVEPVLHTVDTVTGEHTIEPLDGQQLRTARIKSFSSENPEGNVHRAGSVVIEVNPDHIELESATRQKDASAAAPAPNEKSGPTPEQLAAMQAHYSNYLASQQDNSEQAENSRIGPTEERRARMQEHFRAHNARGERPPIRMQGGVSRPSAQQRAEVQARYKKQQSGAPKGKSGKNRPPIKIQKGYQANTGSKSQRPPIKYLPGQGPASKPDPYAGLMGGGGGARRGGGKRRPTEQELEERRRRMGSPKIELVIKS